MDLLDVAEYFSCFASNQITTSSFKKKNGSTQ